ncbi:Hypothetical predicted protein [Mytilus galloprovincialis]|uniref:Uncharacterized protein n=1 Tax=Mytilus galloprovincialis TaxID=29158 RepID=A0A8B6G1B4_MYTGA|nr:Hypothetical predicted protein [Mytilus galloprovincialis]
MHLILVLLERLSTNERTSYIEALQSGKEVRRYVRIQVIGKDGVGKTSLVRRLLRKPIEDGTSTDGIEIDRTCQIRTSDGEWITSRVKTEKETIGRRVLHAINSYPEGKTRVRHRSENYVSETETDEKQGNHKRDPTQDYVLPTTTNELKTFQVDEHKPFQPNQQILIAETLGANLSATKNDNESLTKYTNECSSGLNHSLDDSNPIIRDTVDSALIEQIQSAENQNHLNSDKADEITEAMIKNMDDILLYAKKNKEQNNADTTDGLVDCGIWDFAGKKDYYATHQTFFTPHAIYLIVADITDDIQPMEYDGQFDICSCGDGQK